MYHAPRKAVRALRLETGTATTQPHPRRAMPSHPSKITEVSMYGWINADEADQGLKAAGPPFSRQKVIDTTNKALTHYTAGGLIARRDFSRQHVPPTEADLATRRNADCVAVVQ